MNNRVEVITDLDGTKIALIKNIEFKGSSKEEWREIEKRLVEQVGNCYKIANTNEVIYIGSDFPDEFTSGKDKVALKGANLRAKANVVQAIGELISISNNRSFSPDYGGKHKDKAKNGWFRYDTRIALPVYNHLEQLERYNIYKMRMLVRCDKEGKLYLYDFLRTKKEKEMSSPSR